jgi:tetratricopeptide (TPR) repeat protein
MCLTWAGRYEEGMELAGQMAALAEDIGYRAWGSIDLALFEALMDVHGGRPDAAASRLRENVQTLQNRGQWSLLSSNAATLARILVDLGEEDEATRLARIALDNSATDDVHPQVVARTVQALVLAHRREPSEAEALARGAVERAAPTDWVELRADALRDLASVLRIAGQRAKARTALQQAIALYERKGLLVSSTRARAMLRGQVVAGR